MPTRGFVALRSHSKYFAAYVHYDAAPERISPMLKTHYSKVGKIRKLVNHGAIKSLGKNGEVRVLDSHAEPIVVESMKLLVKHAREYWVHYLYVYEPAYLQWRVRKLATEEEYEKTGGKPKWDGLI